MTSSNRTFILLALAVALLAALVFLPGLSGDFIFDDGPNIQRNTALHLETLDPVALQRAIYSFMPGGGSRTLAELTFALDHWRGGLNPSVFKSTNLAIHVLTTCVLALFFRALFSAADWPRRRALWVSLALALAWAIHPIQVSSVLYVVQRMQTLGTLFMVLALWAYLKMRLAQIEGTRSRQYGVLTGLFWVLAFASKEDSALLPAYTCALELTVLRFRAAQPALVELLRKGYFGLIVLGVVFYLFVVVPNYWSWDAYGGRDFSSLERLLTQGRVLMTYLGQILWPLPSSFPFYYDHFVVSRNLLDPITTLPALAVIAALLALAWFLRIRRPLFTLGVLLFFAGHFISSNVIPLELAFEHRNHFPLIGLVLAVGDLIVWLSQKVQPRAIITVSLCALLLASLGSSAWLRAQTWGDPLALAKNLTKIAPDSPRAWLDLCTRYFMLSEKGANTQYLDEAISACETGGKIPSSAVLLANAIIYKTIRGDVTQADWDIYLDRMRHVTMNIGNKESIWPLLNNSHDAAVMDTQGVLDAIDIVARRAGFNMLDYTRIGYLVLHKAGQPDAAYAYFDMAVRTSSPGEPFIDELLMDLDALGRSEWASSLRDLRDGLGKEKRNIN